MSRITLAILACISVSGCNGMSISSNADPFATGYNALGVIPRYDHIRVDPIVSRNTMIARKAIPSHSVDKDCNSARASGNSGAYENCIQQERGAKDALAKEWEHYPKEARNECASDGRDSWSYLEVMTCFQMLDWIKHPDAIGGVTGAGAVHAKNEAQPLLQLEATPERTDLSGTPNP